MARKSEHKINRTHWNSPIANGKIEPSLLAAYNYNILDNAFHTDTLTQNTIYNSYLDIQNTCYRYLENFLTPYCSIYNFMCIPKPKINIPYPLDKEYISKKRELLYSITDYELKEDFASLPSVHKSLTVFDIIFFLEQCLDFNCANEKSITTYFEESINETYNIYTLKDNKNDRCSDTVIQFNLAMLLTIDKREHIFTIPILSSKESDFVFNGYSETCTASEQMALVFTHLKELSLSYIPFSRELIEATLFFTNISARYRVAYENLYSCLKIMNAIKSSLLVNKSINLMSKHCKELYWTYLNNIIFPFLVDMNVSSSVTPWDLQNLFSKKIDEIENLRAKLNNHFSEFKKEYLTLLPKIQKEVARNEAYEEYMQEKNEAEQEIIEITELMQSNKNNMEKFLQLFSIYNTENYCSEILVLIFNIGMLPAYEQKHLLSLFMKKAEILSTNITDTANVPLQPLEECLSQRLIPYDDILLLTQIDLISISEEEWNFLKILPTINALDRKWFGSFSDFVIANLGDKAYLKIRDIIDVYIPHPLME